MAQLFTEEDNRRLTEVGPGKPMGELLRRYWIPAFLSESLPATDSDPMPVRLLSEDLVAFRGTDGRVGLIDRFCPHRRASLVLARTEDCALRCIYHGWKVDADGKVLETPPEPPNSRFAKSIKHTAYPTREAGGIVWTYMGPPSLTPPFPNLPFNVVDDAAAVQTYFYQPCNWLQGLEGDLDAGHAGYLHYSRGEWERQKESSNKTGKFLFDPRPASDLKREPWGLQTAFRWTLEGGREAAFWVHPFVMPFFTLFETSFGDFAGGSMHAWVPVDDNAHNVYTGIWSNAGPIPDVVREGVLAYSGTADRAAGYISPAWDPVRGSYPQDRESMRSGESFSGFAAIATQDMAIQHSMGPVVDRTKENLGAEDFLVIQLRKFLLDALAKLDRQEPLPGLQEGMDYSKIDYRNALAPIGTPPIDVIEGRAPVGVDPVPDDLAEAEPTWSALPISLG